MAMEAHVLGLLIVASLLWLACWLWAHGLAWALPRGRCPWPRRLRPCTPQDCPACCQTADAVAPAPAPTVPAWRSSQRRRGRPKTIATAGYACPNAACRYYGITDATVHALVGCGHHGAERIQDLRCQACQTKVSARRDTALYRLKTPAAQVSQVLTALATGAEQRLSTSVNSLNPGIYAAPGGSGSRTDPCSPSLSVGLGIMTQPWTLAVAAWRRLER